MIPLPSNQEIVNWFHEFHVPIHVQKHCIVVNLIAQWLAHEIAKKQTLNKELVDKASILHDLFRIVDFKSLDPTKYFEQTITPEDRNVWMHLREKYRGMHHADVAYDFFKDKYPDLANTIVKHKFMLITQLTSWEEKIVYYADKRADGYSIVSLDERFQRGKKRNEHFIKKMQLMQESIAKTEQMVRNLEGELFLSIGKNPLQLEMYLKEYYAHGERTDWLSLFGFHPKDIPWIIH